MAESTDGVTELRLALTVDDVDAAVELFRNLLGMHQVADWSSDQGRCIVLGAARATLEIFDEAQAEFVDRTEVGRRVSGPIRLALQVPDTDDAMRRLGDRVPIVAPVHDTPWGDRNARVEAPGGLQLTLFSTP